MARSASTVQRLRKRYSYRRSKNELVRGHEQPDPLASDNAKICPFPRSEDDCESNVRILHGAKKGVVASLCKCYGHCSVTFQTTAVEYVYISHNS